MKQSFSAYHLVNYLKTVAFLTTLSVVFFALFTSAFYRRYVWKHENSFDQRKKSTCGSEADARGPNQSVISFSLFGDITDPSLLTRYVLPLRALVANISSQYPDWTIRIYSNFTIKSGGIKQLRDLLKSPNIDWCDAERVLKLRNIKQPVFPMTWRFLPLLDPLVDRFLSRDTDGELLDREIQAVRQWLTASNATFHLMRDHPWHCSTEMLGGLWGAKVNQRRQDIVRAANKIFQRRTPSFHGIDQLLLKFYIWPLAATDSVVHDSYCCETFTSSRSRPFPTKRQGSSFVGSVYANKTLPTPGICPFPCRPERHPDWIDC